MLTIGSELATRRWQLVMSGLVSFPVLNVNVLVSYNIWVIYPLCFTAYTFCNVTSQLFSLKGGGASDKKNQTSTTQSFPAIMKTYNSSCLIMKKRKKIGGWVAIRSGLGDWLAQSNKKWMSEDRSFAARKMSIWYFILISLGVLVLNQVFLSTPNRQFFD